MTSEQINALDVMENAKQLIGKSATDAFMHAFLIQTQMIQEIALQLAVLNERLASDKSAINVALCATNDDIPVRIMS